jgi:peptidyl-prolyl cis-trans isomerase D
VLFRSHAVGARAKWQRVDGVLREGAKLDAAILRSVFAMPRPQDGKTVWEQTVVANGDIAVVGLYAVRDGEVVEGEAGAAGDLERAAGEAAFAAALNGIRAGAKVTRPGKQQ